MIITTDGNIPSRFAHSFNVMKMAQGFADAGEDVQLVSLQSLPNLWERIKVRNIRKFYGISKEVKLRFLIVPSFGFFFKRIGIKRYTRKAVAYIQTKKPNFIYCRSYKTVFQAVKIGIPSIIETHTTYFNHPELRKVYSIAHDKSFLGMVTINEALKAGYAKMGVPEEKIVVLEDGVDLALFKNIPEKSNLRKQLRLPDNMKIILYSGSLYKEKGIQQIIDLAQKFSLKREYEFVLVGGTKSQIRDWKNQCDRKKLQNVTFKGFVKNRQVPLFLKAADVLLMPYDTSISYEVMDIHTTSPLKLFEYMASGTPIVSTNIPTISKILTHGVNALLAEPNEIDSLESLIIEACTSPKSVGLAQRAYQDVEEYQWVTRCKTILETFKLK
jgi:glycosyltransferase involved in cell wall biosynthesis